ncbi:MAG: DUF6600 domain-containing protein [Steroidobacteraceae bacterium]
MKLRPAVLVIALAASSFAWGEALDPPGRVARLSYVEGQVAFQGAQATVRSDLPDRPLMPGDRLFTERGGRAELALGTAAVRLDERTDLTIVGLDATTVWVELNTGTASVVVRELLEGEMLEIVTPNTAIALQGPGEYRVEVSADGATALTVYEGGAEVDTADGPVRVAGGQRVRLKGRNAFANLSTLPPEDAFDAWSRAREQELADSESRYALDEGDDYETLDRYGEWYDEPRYGRVWMPAYAYGGWDPFRLGHWERIGFHGRTWVDHSPWSSFTFHSGRWAFLHHLNRWCWVPGQRNHTRHFAHDTRPFGRPRDDARSRNDRNEELRDVTRRTREEGIRRAPVLTDVERRQAAGNLNSTLRRKVAAGHLPRRESPVRGLDRDQSPPRQSTAASRGGAATMRSSGAPAARAQAPSRTAPRTSRPFGSPRAKP